MFFSVFGVAIDFQALPVSQVMTGLSVLAMIVASVIAIAQEDIKRMLAYSSLAQIGYITLGISLANQDGLTGGIVHLVNHAMMKSTLFLVLGAVVYRVGSARLSNLAGIGARMPLTMSAFVVAGLAMIGAPGTSGFVSKWYLALGALDKGAWPLVVMIFVSSLLALVYIGRVVEVAWFRPATGATLAATDPPLSMQTDPRLARSAAKLADQAEYFSKLAKNIIVKVPAIATGVEAIEEATYRGVSINVTVSFHRRPGRRHRRGHRAGPEAP